MSELIDPDFEFRGTVGGLEEGRIAHGAQQFREIFEKEDLDAWEVRRFEPENFVDAGDCVVVLQREYRRGRGSGVELETETAIVFECAADALCSSRDTWIVPRPSKPWGCRSKMRALLVAIAVVTGLLTSWLLGDVAFYVLCGLLLVGAGHLCGFAESPRA